MLLPAGDAMITAQQQKNVLTRNGMDIGGQTMKKREVAAALALLSAVSAMCLKVMKVVGDRLAKEQRPTPPHEDGE